MPQYLFGYMWDECPEQLKKLALSHTFSEKNPAAVLLFDYCYDFQSLEQSYKEQNPEVTKVEISTVKFLSDDIQKLIPPDVNLFANNMFTLVLAW